MSLTGTAELEARITPTEHAAWARHYQRTGLMPQGFRYALARNTHASIAVVAGGDKAGKPEEYLWPPRPKHIRDAETIDEFAKQLEQLAGL